MATSIREAGELIKKVYQESVGGDPDDLVRVYQKGDLYFVIRNDDTHTAIPGGDMVSKNEANIAEALKNFTLID